MSIDEAREQLSAYLDGELDAASRRAVEDALAAHPELRAELDALLRTAGLVRSMPRVAAPTGFASRVAAAIAAEAAPAPARPQARPGGPHAWRSVIVAAAACLLVGFVALVVSRHQQPRSAAVMPPTEEPQAGGPAAREARLRNGAAKAEAEEAEGNAAHYVLKKAAPGRPAAAPAPGALDDRKFAAAPPRPATKAKAAATAPHAGKLDMARRPAPTLPDARRGMAPAPAAKPEPQADAFASRPDAEKAKEAKGMRRRVARKLLPGGPRRDTDRAEQLGRDAESQKDLAPARENNGLIAAIVRGSPSARAKAQAAEPAQPPYPARGGRGLVEAARARAGAGAKPAEGWVEKERAALAYRFGAVGTRERRVELGYDDLRECLAAVQAALGDANVAFAIQPVGRGQFVVEATMPEAEAAALVARLARGPASRADKLAKREEALALEAPPARPAARKPGHLVHVVVHFRPSRPFALPAERQAGERAPAAPADR